MDAITNTVSYKETSASWTPYAFIEASQTSLKHTHDTNVEYLCAPVVHPVTVEMISKYHKLKDDPALKVIWNTAFGKESGNMAQGDKSRGHIDKT